MIQPTYPAAKLVADAVQGHFARHIGAARAADGSIAPDAPTPTAIAAIIDAAFWASLRREEGQTPKISLAFLSPDKARHPLLFASKLPLAPAVLSKVAPAVERPGIHLGVWRTGDDFHVWGTTREVPAFCLVVEVVASGLIVVKHRYEAFGKFVNVAVLEGDQIKIVDEGVGRIIPDCPVVVSSLAGAIDPQVRVRCDRGADPAGGIDAPARTRRRVARRAIGNRDVARVDRRPGSLCGRSAVLGAGAAGAREGR